MTDGTKRIGAVVIGRNEGERLVKSIASLRRLKGRLVYVDSASTDESVEDARKLGAEVVELDMALPFTAARARAEGFARLARLVTGLDYVMFVDGDCEVENGWLETAINFLDCHPEYAVACGRRRERFPEASRYNTLADREWDTPIGETATCGGDAMVRCTAFNEVGGFDPTMIAGEEPELCSRLRAANWRIMRLDAPMTIHDAAMTRLTQWWRRAIRSGFGYAQAWHRTRGKARGGALYQRELCRVIFWAGFLPMGAMGLGLLVQPALVLLWPLALGAQYLRLASRYGQHTAMLALIGKYAELLGALRYLLRLSTGSTGSTIIYK